MPMAFLIRIPKDSGFTPPSLRSFERNDDDSDYLQDPAQFHDVLPQPYRMVNFLVEDIFCDTWEYIKQKEEQEFQERSKIRPHKYECAVVCDVKNQILTCLVESKDGNYIFGGFNGGLLAIEATSCIHVASFVESAVEISSMNSVMISSSIHTILTIDDLGVARLYLFSKNRIYHVKTFSDNDTTVKVCATKFESSCNGDYVGLAYEFVSSQEVCLDVYKLPIETWTKEVENIQSQVAKQSAQLTTELLESQKEKMEEDKHSETTLSYEDSVSVNHPVLVALEQAFKFTSPTLILKVKPPSKPTATTQTLSQVLKDADKSEVLSQGYSNVFTQSFLDQRKNTFMYRHRNLLDYLPAEESENLRSPSFHFLTQSRMTVSIDTQLTPDSAASVLVWWSGGRILYNYSLVKFPSKEIEQKPDMIIPVCRTIQFTVTSQCTNQLAIALNLGVIVLWDRLTALQRGVADLGADHCINSIHFINPSIYKETGLSANITLPVPVILLVLSNQTYLHRITFGPACGQVEITKLGDSNNEEVKTTYICPLETIPNVIARVQRDGTVYLYDIISRSPLCQLSLPLTHTVSSPWQPVLALGCKGLMLYITGSSVLQSSCINFVSPANQVESEQTLSYESHVTTSNTTDDHTLCEPSMDVQDQSYNCTQDQLFVFPMRSFPCLDEMLPDVPTLSLHQPHMTLQPRVTFSMQNRLVEQGERKKRLQTRWFQFKDELALSQKSSEPPTSLFSTKPFVV